MYRDYLIDLLNILNSQDTLEEKKTRILQYHESDIAELLDELDDEKREELYKILGTDKFGEVLVYSEDVNEILEDFEPEEVADIIETLDADDAIDVLEELDDESRNEVVSLLDQ